MKINGETIKAEEFAYDGCHKIFLIETPADRDEANEVGFDILPINKLKKTFDDSCGLQFISNWSWSKRYVEQLIRRSLL